MPDGSITISTELDNKGLERQLAKVKREIEKLDDSISNQEAQKSPLVQQAQELEWRMRAARGEVQKYEAAWKAGVSGADKNQTAAVLSAQQIGLQYERVVAQIEKMDAKLTPAYAKMDRMKEVAGGLEQELASARDGSVNMGAAVQRAEKHASKFKSRMREVVRSALVFTVITQALAKFRGWVGNVVKTNSEAMDAVARLKGALLTLAQPLVNVIIPAFTILVNLLTDVVRMAANVMAALFGTTAKDAADSAENLYDEQQAIDGVGEAAKKASKAMANFDDINQISDGNQSTGGADKNNRPDFSSFEENDMDWLEETLGTAAGWVTAALMLGGIALVAIGACTGHLPLVIVGLALLGTGVSIGEQSGVLQSWADVLMLNTVQEFVVVAVMLGGIALVAMGAATANVFLVLAGLGIVWGDIAYTNTSGMAGNWTEDQASRAAGYVTAALMLGGIALIAIGAATANLLMLMAGLGLLSAGIYVGASSGTLESWADTLGLNSVFSYVTAAIELVGIALVAIGAAMANIAMIVSGAILLAVGIVAENVGQQTLQSWWEVLKLTSVQQWVSVALLLVGVALIAIGAAMANVLMVVAGAATLGLGVVVGTQNGNLKDWVETLGLGEVAGWVTAGLMLAGLAFVVFGIVTANVLMIIAGIGLIGAGVAVGASSGTLESWVDVLHLDEVSGWVATALSLAGIALIAIGAATMNPLMILAGLGLLGAGVVVGAISSSNNQRISQPTANMARAPMPSIAQYEIPALATGAVIPPNNEFLAVLGDQRRGTNIETPESLLRQIVREEGGGNGAGGEITVRIIADGKLARALKTEMDNESRRRGVKLVTGGAY